MHAISSHDYFKCCDRPRHREDGKSNNRSICASEHGQRVQTGPKDSCWLVPQFIHRSLHGHGVCQDGLPGLAVLANKLDRTRIEDEDRRTPLCKPKPTFSGTLALHDKQNKSDHPAPLMTAMICQRRDQRVLYETATSKTKVMNETSLSWLTLNGLATPRNGGAKLCDRIRQVSTR